MCAPVITGRHGSVLCRWSWRWKQTMRKEFEGVCDVDVFSLCFCVIQSTHSYVYHFPDCVLFGNWSWKILSPLLLLVSDLLDCELALGG